MEVSQIYDLVNTTTKEVLGQEAVVNEDLSNVVDIGTEITSEKNIDNYVRALVDHIGRVIFVNRPYSGSAVSVLMDSWEYGSILEKITVDSLPVAEENESWQLEEGTSYDPNIFYKPQVSAKFFNKRTTFQVPMSFTREQVKSSFSSVEQLNGFISMIYNSIDKSITVKLDSLIMRTINNMIGETIHSDYSGQENYNTSSGVKAVNLLYLYNQRNGTQLTQSEAILTPDFIRFAAYIMGLYKARLGEISTLFNVGGKDRFTTVDRLHVVTLAEFRYAASMYLQSDVFHDEMVALPNSEIVASWQGSGIDYSFTSTSAINVKTASGNTVDATGILGVMFDRDALGVCNMDKHVTTNYNPKAEFYNEWFKQTYGYFNDTNENFVVFFAE